MVCVGAGVVVVSLAVGDEEIGVLCLLVGLGGEGGTEGRYAGVGDGSGRQAGAGVGVVGRPDVLRDAVPAAVIGRDPVPEIVVVGVALDVAGGVALELGVGRTLGQTVAEHLRHVVVLRVARLLLHEGRQRHHLGQGHPLLVHRRIHLVGDLLIEVGIERLHIMMDGVVLQKVVGVREKIALTLEEAVGGVLVVRDVLPEPVRAEIAGVGLRKEVLGAAQPRVLHLPGDGDGRRALGEGQPDAVGLRVGREGRDDGIVGAAGSKLELSVLELRCRALPAHIPAEQIGRADDSGILEPVGDRGHAAALRDAYRYFGAGFQAVSVYLPIGKQRHAARRQDHDQQHS